MRLWRITWRINPPFSPLEVAVFVAAAIPALIAGYLYGLWLFGFAQ